jgi:hypothetical protein
MTRPDPNTVHGQATPDLARVSARAAHPMDAQGALEHRRALLAGLAGRVLEVGAGNGLNFAHYPPAVTELLAVEPEPYLRALTETAAQQAAIPIRGSTTPPMPCPVPMPAWTPLSHRWCCARCPTKPAPWLNSSRDPLTAITTAGFQLISTRRFPVSRQPAAVASRAPCARYRPPPTRIPTGGAPSDRLAHRRVSCEPELRPDSARCATFMLFGRGGGRGAATQRGWRPACCAGRPVAARRRRVVLAGRAPQRGARSRPARRRR